MKSKSSNHWNNFIAVIIFVLLLLLLSLLVVPWLFLPFAVDVFFVLYICWRSHCIHIYGKIDWSDCWWFAGILQWFGSSNAWKHFSTMDELYNVTWHMCANVFRILRISFSFHFEFFPIFLPIHRNKAMYLLDIGTAFHVHVGNAH